MAKKYDFDWDAFNAWRLANPGLSGRGGPYTDGSGTNAMVYDSMPLSATGGAWNYGGMVIQPLLDEPGNFIVYHGNNEPGKASRLNGTLADKLDSQGNYLGDYEIKGATDNNAGADFLTGAAMMLPGMYLTAAGAGAGAAGGVGAAEGAGGGWMSGVEGSALAGPEVAGMTGAELAAGGGALTGVLPPANPFLAGGLTAGGGAGLLGSLGSLGGVLGPAATVAGALLGGKGQEASTSSTRELPEYLQQPVTDLVGRTQGLLGAQMPGALQAGAQMVQQGQGLLSQGVAGNGVGKVTLNAPTTSTNPYLSGMADDISRRTSELLGQNNVQIQGNAVGVGGLGGSRQGVAQGIAAGKAADYLSGNLANLYGQQYNLDQNRALQQYGMDQSFYGNQRGQDLAQVGIGSGLVSQGLQTQWSPINQAASTYAPFSGMGTTTQTQQQGGGWGGALGGALGTAQLGKNMGWW